jgi:DUF4097 and DUF4098 domain-containing protein YvlB
MLRWFFLLLLAMPVISVSASAHEWKKDYGPSGKPVIRVDANDADIRVNDWDRKDVEARVITEGYKIGPDAVRVTESQSGNQVTLEVHTPRLFGLVLHRHSVRVEVSMPQQGDLNLHSGDGNIRIANIQGDLRLGSGDGDLEIRSADGSLNAETHDGNIRANGRFDALTLHTGDGNIDAEAEAGSKNSSGWNLHTGDGNVALRLPSDFAADLDAETGDGRVNIAFPLTMNGSVKERSVCGERSTAADRCWNCGPEMGTLNWRRVEAVWIIQTVPQRNTFLRNTSKHNLSKWAGISLL